MKRIYLAIAFMLFLLSSFASAGTLTLDTYYHNDHLGSPASATDERGDLLWRSHYLPYGERRENTSEASFGSVGYTGHAQDSRSALVYMGARYFDPVIGRFLAVDPVGFNSENAISFNRFAYANDNPLKYWDPDGRMSDEAVMNGNWTPGFEGNIYTGSSNWGPIGGARRGLTPQGESVNVQGVRSGGTKSRSGAFREAKEKGDIPRSQQPDKVYKERIRDQEGNVQGRVYEFKRQDGSIVTVREHSLGHQKGNHGPHFNSEVRGPDGVKLPLKGGGDSHTYFRGAAE